MPSPPLDPNDLATDLITALSTSSDPASKALVDAAMHKLAICITDQIKRGTVIVPSTPATVNVT